jgi:hypothetical protein
MIVKTSTPDRPGAASTSRTALTILFASLTLGLLGDMLLRATPWGLNAGLWIVALAIGIAAITQWRPIDLSGGGRWLVLPAIVFAAGLAWRDSFTLQACNFLAVIIALALVAYRGRRGQVRVAGFVDYAAALIVTGVNACFGVLSLVFGDIQWTAITAGRERSRQVVAVSTGLLIALPLLIVFGGLLASADAVFQSLIKNLFNWNVDQLLSHGFTIGVWSWLVAGFLRQTFLTKDSAPSSTSAASISLGAIEIGTALGALNLLFFVFVLVQFRYFFGGAEAIRTTIDLTYAEYARRGFFELVQVAALALPTLLLAHHLLKKDQRSGVRSFNVLAAITIGLLFIIMLSAVLRMKLYTDEFGLTELRLYTTAFMGWLALLFVWFGATVLRGQRDRFVFGALIAGFAVLIGLNALNPDALIVRTNAARLNAPNPLDAAYMSDLSADSVPALIDALPSMAQTDRCAVAARLIQRWSPPAAIDPLTWNWSRTQAWQAFTTNQAYLQANACPLSRD